MLCISEHISSSKLSLPSNTYVDLTLYRPRVFNDRKDHRTCTNYCGLQGPAETTFAALDDAGTAKHAGLEENELQRRRRQLRLAKAG